VALAEAGSLQLARESVDPADLVTDAVASFQAAATGAGLALVADAPPGLPRVQLDPARMRQVLGNLVENALRHTPRGGTVRVTTARDDASLVFSVSDTGTGIPAALLPHVFERFAKGAGSPGSGLGLAIARDLVQAHGGTIEVTSPPGAGTTFRIRLPL
jgi:two-component system, OmpR family, sensor histidine kinase BaeS